MKKQKHEADKQASIEPVVEQAVAPTVETYEEALKEHEGAITVPHLLKAILKELVRIRVKVKG